MIGWLFLYSRIRRLEDKLDPPPPPRKATRGENIAVVWLLIGLFVLIVALSACTTDGACAPYGTCTVERER